MTNLLLVKLRSVVFFKNIGVMFFLMKQFQCMWSVWSIFRRHDMWDRKADGDNLNIDKQPHTSSMDIPVVIEEAANKYKAPYLCRTNQDNTLLK